MGSPLHLAVALRATGDEAFTARVVDDIVVPADVAQGEGAEPAGEAIRGIPEPAHRAAAGGARNSSGSPKPPSGQRRIS